MTNSAHVSCLRSSRGTSWKSTLTVDGPVMHASSSVSYRRVKSKDNFPNMYFHWSLLATVWYDSLLFCPLGWLRLAGETRGIGP